MSHMEYWEPNPRLKQKQIKKNFGSCLTMEIVSLPLVQTWQARGLLASRLLSNSVESQQGIKNNDTRYVL